MTETRFLPTPLDPDTGRGGTTITAGAAALAATGSELRGSQRPLRLAYVMSRFPKITETFILFEMIAAEREGAAVEVYPLWREPTRVMHGEAEPYVARAHFRHLLSPRVWAANVRCFARQPLRYGATLGTGLRANWGSLRYFLGFLAAFPKAVAFGDDMRRRGVQHVHAHFASHPAAAAWVIHALFELPFSFTAHGSDLHRDVHMLREKVRDARFVVAISEFNRTVIQRVCGDCELSKLVVLHCGTDTDVFRPRAIDAESAPELQLTCIGTLHEVKGQRYLLEAARVLRERGCRFRLNFVGDGPDEAELRRLAESWELEPCVTWQGRRTRTQIADLLGRTDIVVAPSVPTRDGRREGIPVVLMEAMACGLPVVASRLSGIPELVEDRVHGRLVTPAAAEELADALQEMMSRTDLRNTWGRAARQRIVQRFDVQRNAGQLVAFIRSAAAGREQEEPCCP